MIYYNFLDGAIITIKCIFYTKHGEKYSIVINFNRIMYYDPPIFNLRFPHSKEDHNVKKIVITEHKKKDKVKHKHKEVHRKDDQVKHFPGNHHHHYQLKNALPTTTGNNIHHNIHSNHNYNSYGSYDVNSVASPDSSDDIAAFESIVYLQNYAKYCKSYHDSLYKLTPENRIYLEKSFELVRQIPLLRDEPDLTFKIEDITLKWSVIYSKLKTFVNKVYSNRLYKAIQDHAFMSSNQHLGSINCQEQGGNWSSWYSQNYNYSHQNNSGAAKTQSSVHSRQGSRSNSTDNYNYSNQLSAKQPQSSNNKINMSGMEAYFPHGYHLSNQQHESMIGTTHSVHKKKDEPKDKPKPKTQRSFSYPSTQVSQPQFPGNDLTSFHKNRTTKSEKSINGHMQNTASNQHYKSVIEPTIQYNQPPAQTTVQTCSLISSVQAITTVSSNTSNISIKPKKSQESTFSRPWEMPTQPKNNKGPILELPLNGKYSMNDVSTSLSHIEPSKGSSTSLQVTSSVSVVMSLTNVLLPQYSTTTSQSNSIRQEAKPKEHLSNKIDNFPESKKIDLLSQNEKNDNSSQSEYSEIESSSCAEDNNECDQSVYQEYMAWVKKFMEQKKEKCYTSVIKQSPLKNTAAQKKPKKPRVRQSAPKDTPTFKIPSTNQINVPAATKTVTTRNGALATQEVIYSTPATISFHSVSQQNYAEKSCFQAPPQLDITQTSSRATSASNNSSKINFPKMVDIPSIDTTMNFFIPVNKESVSSQQINPHWTADLPKEKSLLKTSPTSMNSQQGFWNESTAFTTVNNSINCLPPSLHKTSPAVKASAIVTGKTKDGKSSSSNSFSLESILSHRSFVSSQQEQPDSTSKYQTTQSSSSHIKFTSSLQRESVLVNGLTSDKHQPISNMIRHPASSLIANRNFVSQHVDTTISNTLSQTKSILHSPQFNMSFTEVGDNPFSKCYITPPEQLAGFALGLSSPCSAVLGQTPKPRRFIKALSGIQKVTQLTDLDKLSAQLVYQLSTEEQRISKSITIEDEDGLIDHFFKMQSLKTDSVVSDEQVVLSEKIDPEVEDATTTVEVIEKSRPSTMSSSTKRLQLDEVLIMFEQEALDIQNREATTTRRDKCNMINIGGSLGSIDNKPNSSTAITQQQQQQQKKSNDGTVETRIFFGNDEKLSSESDIDLLSPGKHAINGLISTYQQESDCKSNDLLLQETSKELPISVHHQMDSKDIAETIELKQSLVEDSSNKPSSKSRLHGSLEPPSFSQSIQSVKKLNSTLGKSKMVKTSSLTPFDKNHKCIPSADLKKLFPEAFLPPPQIVVKSLGASNGKKNSSTTKTLKKVTSTTQTNGLTTKLKKVLSAGPVSRSKPKVVLVDQLKQSATSPSTRRSTRKSSAKKREGVRRSGRSMVNTMARIHQCNFDGSSSTSENEDDVDDDEMTEEEDLNIIDSSQDETEEEEDVTPLGSPTNRKPASILNEMNLSPVVNVTDAKHIVNTTTNNHQINSSTSTSSVSTSDNATEQKNDLISNLQDWLNKRQGKIQIINSPPPMVSPPLPTTTTSTAASNFNLITLSDLASKIKTIDSGGPSPTSSSTTNNSVALKKSKVVLQNCTSSDLTKALETVTASRLSDIKELSNRRLNINLDNSILGNRLPGKTVKASELHPVGVVVGTPAKKQKKKKYWYPKGNELESDESPLKSTLSDRSNLKRKTGGANNSSCGGRDGELYQLINYTFYRYSHLFYCLLGPLVRNIGKMIFKSFKHYV